MCQKIFVGRPDRNTRWIQYKPLLGMIQMTKIIDQLDLKKKKEFNSRNPKKLLLLRKKCYLFLLQVSRGVTSWSTDWLSTFLAFLIENEIPLTPNLSIFLCLSHRQWSNCCLNLSKSIISLRDIVNGPLQNFNPSISYLLSIPVKVNKLLRPLFLLIIFNF